MSGMITVIKFVILRIMIIMNKRFECTMCIDWENCIKVIFYHYNEAYFHCAMSLTMHIHLDAFPFFKGNIFI